MNLFLRSKIVALFLGVITLSSCLVDMSSVPGVGGAKKKSISPQKVNKLNSALPELMSLIKAANCGACHSSLMSSGGTAFGDANENTAYEALKILVDYSNPTNSHIIDRSQDSHYNSTGKKIDVATWEEKISNFVKVENEKNSTPIVPPVIPIPAPLFQSANISIDGGNTTAVNQSVPIMLSGIPSGLSFSLNIQGKSTGGTTELVIIKASVMNSSSSTITFKGLRIFQGSTTKLDPTKDYDPARGGAYFDITTTLKAGESFNYTVPSFIELQTQKGVPSNRLISLGLQSVVVEVPGAKKPCEGASLVLFKTYSDSAASSCMGCHGSGSGRAYRFLTDDTTSCLNARNQVDISNIANSKIIRKGKNLESHGGGNVLKSADETLLSDWIKSFQ